MLSCPFSNECAQQAIKNMLKNSINPPKILNMFQPLDTGIKFQILLYLFPILAEDYGLTQTLKNMISFSKQYEYEYAILCRYDIYEPTKNSPLILFEKMIHRYTMTDRKLLGDFAPILYLWLRDTELKNMLAEFWFNQLAEVVNMRQIKKYIGCFQNKICFFDIKENETKKKEIIIFFSDMCYNNTPEFGTEGGTCFHHFISYMSLIYRQTGICQNIILHIAKSIKPPEELEKIMWKNLPNILEHSLPIDLRKIVGEYLGYPKLK